MGITIRGVTHTGAFDSAGNFGSAGGLGSAGNFGSAGDFDLAGRVIIITGGTKGIGIGLARYLGGCGASVVVTGRRQVGVDSASAELRALASTIWLGRSTRPMPTPPRS